MKSSKIFFITVFGILILTSNSFSLDNPELKERYKIVMEDITYDTEIDAWKNTFFLLDSFSGRMSFCRWYKNTKEDTKKDSLPDIKCDEINNKISIK